MTNYITVANDNLYHYLIGLICSQLYTKTPLFLYLTYRSNAHAAAPYSQTPEPSQCYPHNNNQLIFLPSPFQSNQKQCTYSMISMHLKTTFFNFANCIFQQKFSVCQSSTPTHANDRLCIL